VPICKEKSTWRPYNAEVKPNGFVVVVERKKKKIKKIKKRTQQTKYKEEYLSSHSSLLW